MRLLLDTHVLLWWLADDQTLGAGTRSTIAAADNLVFVSAASAWEISIKRSLGKLDAPSDLIAQLERNRFEPLSITVDHAYAAGALPHHHEDPFDRILVAQALAEELTLVTRDPRLDAYGVTAFKA